MRFYLLLALVACAYAQDDCPAYGDWREWTDCLWGTLTGQRVASAAACGVEIKQGDADYEAPIPALINNAWPAEACGNCARKVRCQKRLENGQPKAECFALKQESEQCGSTDVCDVKAAGPFKCDWAMAREHLVHCFDRADFAPAQADGYRALAAANNPHANCKDVGDDNCKCCCDPYTVSEDNQQCEMQTPAECSPWGDMTDPSKCLWLPATTMHNDFVKHCEFGSELPEEDAPEEEPATSGGLPGKCGFCSFQVRCRMREVAAGQDCAPVETLKKSCGNDQCPNCGDICDLPKREDGSCDYNTALASAFGDIFKKYAEAAEGYERKKSLMRMKSLLPHGTCKVVDDRCKCCCHPYVPNEAGDACVVADVCKVPTEIDGVTINWDV